jgi:hypothetical protein
MIANLTYILVNVFVAIVFFYLSCYLRTFVNEYLSRGAISDKILKKTLCTYVLLGIACLLRTLFL